MVDRSPESLINRINPSKISATVLAVMIGGISAFIRSPTGESRPFCSIYSGKPFSFFAELFDRPSIIPKGDRYPLKGGETIEFSCSSFMPPSERVIGKGCTVDVDLWLRLKTNHTPPGEEIEILQPTE